MHIVCSECGLRKEQILSVKGYCGLYFEKAHDYTVWANVCDFLALKGAAVAASTVLCCVNVDSLSVRGL